MKRKLRNLSKGKLAVGLLVVCLLAFGGFFGYQKLTVHADSTKTKQVVNTLEEYQAMCADGKVDPTQEAGDKNNPFLILEIVPYYGQAEIGYLIDGCEPIDFYKMYPSKYGDTKAEIRSVATTVFSDEYRRDANEDDVVDETCWDDFEWKNNTTKSITVHGYYEKVANGKKGDFVIDHYEQDTTGMFYAKDENGVEHEAYRPVFRKAKDGETGDFIWVTVFNMQTDTYTLSTSSFNQYAQNENQYVASADETIDYEPGDREYTTRTDTNYYYINESGWNEINGEKVFEGHTVNMNSFIRTSLDLDDESTAAILNFKLAVKTIEPSELKEHPEWIDYADLVYIHKGTSVDSFPKWWLNDNYKQYRRVKCDDSYYKAQEDAGTLTTSDFTPAGGLEFTADDDWGWNVAKKLFFKVNQLGEYDGNGTYGFAPLIITNSTTQNFNLYQGSATAFGNSKKSVTNYHLDYATMETGGTAATADASNCGFYKFMLMNFMMEQENFYEYFFNTKTSSGSYVITEDTSKDISYCTPQEEGDPQVYWNDHTFYPISEVSEWSTQLTDEQKEKYGIESNYYNFNSNNGDIRGGTFIYNDNNIFSQMFNSDQIKETDYTRDAFDWWEDEYGYRPDSLSPAELIHYLLQYKRHGSDDDDIRTRDKETMHVLEIEPCADFTLSETYLTGKYLPASRFSGEIEVDHMTTAEFNGLQRDINGYYDLIYIGDNTGKLNTDDSSGKTKHNDDALDGYIYLHVGDKVDGKRTSGNDISKLKRTQLQKYAQGGNALVLADSLASFPKNDAGNNVTSGEYIDTYSKIVDSTSQMHKLLNSLKSTKKAAFKRTNVCALSNLKVKFLSENCLNYMSLGYSLPTRAQTGLKSKVYKELTAKYEDLEGILCRIDSTPPTYVSDAGMADEDDAKGGSGVKTSLSGSTLDFAFTIGDQRAENESKYGVRLYIDLDDDGVISSDELVQDTYENGSGATYSYVGEDAVDASGNAYTNKKGEAIQVPRQQTYSYDFSKNTRINLIKNKKVGAITWKFVLYNTNEKENYLSVTGTSRYDNPNAINKKNTIKALQIVSDAQKEGQANLQTQLDDGNSLFATYAANLEDFDISVTTMTLSEMSSQLQAGTLTGSASGSGSTTDVDYNSYIVSCGSELFNGQEANQMVADYLVEKAKQGVAMVFTGDAYDAEDTATDGKDLLGMSRFNDQLGLYGDIEDKATSPKNSTYDNTDVLEYTYATVMQKASGATYKVYKNKLWENVKYGAVSKSKKSTRNNKGRLTTYPYTIDKTIDTSGRSAQDYQLNMDNEGLVVWYSLGSEAVDDTEYGISPRDASNNYYLYSIENVTYDLIDLANVTDAMEMKLFINTLSGSVVSPLVTVDSGKAVDSNYKDLTITEATEKYFTLDADGTKKSSDGSDITVYRGIIQPDGSDYRDYEEGSTRIQDPSSGKGSGSSGSSGKSDGEADATAPPTATPVPKKEPKILHDGSTGAYQNYSTSDKVFEGWDEDAVLVIEYNNVAQSWATDGLDCNAGMFDLNWNKIVGLPYYSSDNGKTTCMVTLGELKKKVGASSIDDIAGFKINSGYITLNLYTIGIFADSDQYYEYAGIDSGSGGTSDTEDYSDEDTTLEETYEKVDSKSYIPDSATHRINFTPYTNTTGACNVYKFKISLVTASADNLGTSDESTIEYVDTIYRKVTKADGSKETWKYTANANHEFTVVDLNFLRDKEQYYFFSDDSYINSTTSFDNDKTRWVRFDISNRRKSAITYLHMYYEGDVDTTYVFPLD